MKMQSCKKCSSKPQNRALLAAQTTHALNGSGLLPWRGTLQRTFEAQYSSLLAARGIDSSGLTYVGSLVGISVHQLSVCFYAETLC